MKNSFIFLCIGLLTFSCNSTKNEDNFFLSGNIKGLKKGMLYLEKIKDTSVVVIDSAVISGSSNFQLSTYLDEPEMLYLYLQKTEGVENYERLDFFAEPGEMLIETSLEKFNIDAKVSGSENHEKLEEFKKLMQRYNDRSLDVLKASLEAEQRNKTAEIDKLQNQYESLMRSKYLAAVNYAIANKDKSIAPYIVLSQIYDANIKYLDTVYQSLNEDVKVSKYGKQLQQYIDERKKETSATIENEA